MNDASLIDLAGSYLLARPACQQYAKQIRSRMRLFDEWLVGRAPTAALLNEYLITLESRQLEPETVRGHRSVILAVLKFSGWKPESPIRVVRLRHKEPDCFTLDEIRRLLAAAEKLTGELPNGISHAAFWSLAIDVGYSTGLRYGDMTTLRASIIPADGECRVVQSKTGRFVDVRFTPWAIKAIRAHGHDLAVPWPHCGNHFRTEFRAIMVGAGVRRGRWKMMRASAGSYAELEHPGKGHRLLGNTRDVFRKSYFALRLLRPKAVRPTSLRRSWWRRLFGRAG